MDGQWFEDDTVKVDCSDDDDTTTTAHPTGQSISEADIFIEKYFGTADTSNVFYIVMLSNRITVNLVIL